MYHFFWCVEKACHGDMMEVVSYFFVTLVLRTSHFSCLDSLFLIDRMGRFDK